MFVICHVWLHPISVVVNGNTPLLILKFCSESTGLSLNCYALACEVNMAAVLRFFLRFFSPGISTVALWLAELLGWLASRNPISAELLKKNIYKKKFTETHLVWLDHWLNVWRRTDWFFGFTSQSTVKVILGRLARHHITSKSLIRRSRHNILCWCYSCYLVEKQTQPTPISQSWPCARKKNHPLQAIKNIYCMTSKAIQKCLPRVHPNN